jgi:curved DNA-binding protein CbpA
MDSFALLRALASEQRARDASDPAVKKEWEALAIEWHQLANTAAKATNKVPQTAHAASVDRLMG